MMSEIVRRGLGLPCCITAIFFMGLLCSCLNGCVPEAELGECAKDEDCLETEYCKDKECVDKLLPGDPCEQGMDNACSTGYCDGHFCCAGGDCCKTPQDCPSGYSIESKCSNNGLDTDCQGQRQDADCLNNVCKIKAVDDDSGCVGVEHACPDHFASVFCSDDADQPVPVCLDTCVSHTDCVTGYQCDDTGSCTAIVGLGEPCGPKIGVCPAELKCENGVCCDATGPACCADSAACANGLACNMDSFSCFQNCNDFDTSRCADENTYCLNNVCKGKGELGSACEHDSQCLSGMCVESVCCDGLCQEECHSCLNSQTGQDDGTCKPKLDGSGCAGTPGKCCSGVCDNDDATTGVGFHLDCRTNAQCLEAGNWGYAAINDNSPCGDWEIYCFNPNNCDTHRRKKSCASGSCSGSYTSDENAGTGACQDEVCDISDQCSSNTYYDGKKCSTGEGSGACSVFYGEKGCCANSKCGTHPSCGWCVIANHHCEYTPAGQTNGTCTGDFVCDGGGNCCISESKTCSTTSECCGGTTCCAFNQCCRYCCVCSGTCGSFCTASSSDCDTLCGMCE